MISPAPCLIGLPFAFSPALSWVMIFINSIEVTSYTEVAPGWSPTLAGSPVSGSTWRMPSADIPIKVALKADDIVIAAAQVEQGSDAEALLQHGSDGQIAHAENREGVVGQSDGIGPGLGERLGAGVELLQIQRLRRIQLGDDDRAACADQVEDAPLFGDLGGARSEGLLDLKARRTCGDDFGHGHGEDLGGHRGDILERLHHGGDVLRVRAAAAADELCPLAGRAPPRHLRSTRGWYVDEPPLVVLGIAGIRVRGEQPFRGEPLEKAEHGLRAIRAVHAHDIRSGGAQLGESVREQHPIRKAPLRSAGHRADHGAMVKRLLHVERQEQLIEIEKGLEENDLRASVQQGAHLFGKDRLAIDAAFLRLLFGEAERADAARHIDVLPRALSSSRVARRTS